MARYTGQGASEPGLSGRGSQSGIPSGGQFGPTTRGDRRQPALPGPEQLGEKEECNALLIVYDSSFIRNNWKKSRELITCFVCMYLYVFGNSGDTAGCVCVRIVIVSMIYCHSNIGPEWSLKTRHSFHPRLKNRTQNVFFLDLHLLFQQLTLPNPLSYV